MTRIFFLGILDPRRRRMAHRLGKAISCLAQPGFFKEHFDEVTIRTLGNWLVSGRLWNSVDIQFR
jgi:hypothetical protein